MDKAPVLARTRAAISLFSSGTVVLTSRFPLDVSPMKLNGVSLVEIAPALQ